MTTFIEGMHGLGDNIRQRALVRSALNYGPVWLTSSWVSVYHDLIPRGLHIISRNTSLRTQAKNAEREAASFSKLAPPRDAKRLKVWYPPDLVRREGTILKAMNRSVNINGALDFTFPVPQEWVSALLKLLPDIRKPIMLYRPLIERTEWTGCAARNPDYDAYYKIWEAIRAKYYVISVADLVPGKEWIAGIRHEVDLKFHAGELSVEMLFALTHLASLVYCSPGFAAVMAQAVGTPVVCVFGGYERSSFFFDGVQRSHCIGIDTIKPCDCFSHVHNCEKKIDVNAALKQIEEIIIR